VSADRQRLATAELLGALVYGQMRAFAAAARVVPLAPSLREADTMVRFSERERERYRALRDRLGELTDLPEGVVERQRGAFDRYFESLPLDSWLGALVFLAVGLPVAADFARAVAPTVDERTAEVILESLTLRDEIEEFATSALRTQLDDPAVAEQARSLVADVVGHALTSFTGALGETDALQQLFAEHAEEHGTEPDQIVKRTALSVLEQHRRRMHALGLDDLE
jgi:hypothetical protein